MFFEQIIHSDYTNKGVLDVRNIPADLIDPSYENIQNMLVKGFILKKPIFKDNNPNEIEAIELVPMEKNQIVYISSGEYNESKEFVIPFIENCRRAMRQLTMIEDSIVIHRMVHAPLRFIFNVDVGRLPVPQAERYLKQLQNQYWSTKTFDVDQNDVVKKYKPQSTLDSFWFAKREGSEGTSVQEIGGNTNLGALDDLHFFIKKLYRSLKTPSTRINPEDAFRDGTDLLREELKFARMIIRQQEKFAAGIKRGFISHLKLKKMIDNDNYDFDETNIRVKFNVPTNFYDLRENQKIELKVNTYNNITSSGKVSDSFAKKKYLKWTDKDILADRELRRKDAELEFELNKILELGPNWKAIQNIGGGEVGGDGLGGGGLGGDIPEFGGGEVAVPSDGGDSPDIPEVQGPPTDELAQ